MMFEKTTTANPLFLDDEEITMKIYKVSIYLKNKDCPDVGWLVGKTTIEAAHKIRCQNMVLFASTCEGLEEAGYNMSEVKEIVGYNSSEIVKYYVEEYGVILCSIK